MRDKNAKHVLLAIVAVLVVLGGTTGAVWIGGAHKTDKPSVAVAPAPGTAVKAAATTRIAYQGVAGKTALELLKAKAQIITKDSSYGPYVDTINGIKGGTDGKYWAFYINGKLSQVGADAYVTNNGDSIEWKFE